MLYLGSDHRGFKLKEKLKEWLVSKKIDFIDLGAEKFDSGDDYPDIAKKVGEKIGEGKIRGVLLCGSGGGICIAANKVKGVRAAIGFNAQQVRKMVDDDDLNILCLAADYTKKFKAFQLVKAFLNSKFKNKGKYLRRVEKIKKLEK